LSIVVAAPGGVATVRRAGRVGADRRHVRNIGGRVRDDAAVSRSGDLHENGLTGERSLILHGTDDGPERRIVALVTVPAHGAVIGEHLHPSVHERVRVVSGRMGVKVGGQERVVGPGEEVDLPPGIAHDWWNAGDDEAQFIVYVTPGDRFELMISTLFGLASDGKTNAKGIPNLLQIAVVAWEFDDIVRFVKPPRIIQRTLFGVLAPIGRALGYLPVYGKYFHPLGRIVPDPEIMELAGLAPADYTSPVSRVTG
jgi:quercetin dioxygenase-like cupin family protein